MPTKSDECAVYSGRRAGGSVSLFSSLSSHRLRRDTAIAGVQRAWLELRPRRYMISQTSSTRLLLLPSATTTLDPHAHGRRARAPALARAGWDSTLRTPTSRSRVRTYHTRLAYLLLICFPLCPPLLALIVVHELMTLHPPSVTRCRRGYSSAPIAPMPCHTSPSTTTVTSVTCSVVAIAMTVTRLWIRRGRFWYDDGCAHSIIHMSNV